MPNSFSVPADRRFFEDYKPGHVYDLGTTSVSQSQIIEFAREFDPQPFHLDPAAAAATQFGGIIASGWHTASLVMRRCVDHYLSPVSSLGSPGVEDLRWPNPLKSGDTLGIRATILEARPSRSRPDRGIVRTRVEAVNQNGDPVLTMIAVNFLRRRPESSATSAFLLG